MVSKAKVRSLEDAFFEELKDIYNAEKQILRSLPKLSKKASHEELKQAFDQHRQQTEQHVNRLEKAFEMLGRPARSKRCEGMEGIIEEGQEVMQEAAEPHIRDASLIGAAQKMEHYEIAAYGTVCSWAQALGHQETADLLHQTLIEEKETDAKLTELAKQMVNREAAAVHA
ncbi:MAG TPA: ferritin-like domain-containing protein [Phycisphaeraceae bacterium]